MELHHFIIIAIIGLAAGLLGGLLGLGGAIIMIPSLVMFLGYSQQMAQGTALMMMVLPVGALAAYQYYQNGYVEMKAALITVSYTHLRAHETDSYLVCRLLLEKKKK